MTSQSAKPTISWLTNLPAPYRTPIYDQLTSKFEVMVYFMGKEKNFRKWTLVNKQFTWKSTYLSGKQFQLGEFELIWSNLHTIPKILKGTDLLILESWDSFLGLLLLVISRIRKLPVIMFYESHEFSHKYKRGPVRQMRKFFFKNSTIIFTAGKLSTKSAFVTGGDFGKIKETFMSVDVDKYRVTLNQENPQLGTGGHIFLYVGQLTQRKNVSSLINAFKSISENDDQLVIVGEGELAQDLEKLAGEFKGKLKFLGHKEPDDLVKIYNFANTLILPSLTEVWGLVVNEALAAGMHVVVHRLAGVSSNIESMQGVYFCETDPESIAKSMKESRDLWRGRIMNPEILNYGISKMSFDLEDAINLALSRST